MDLGLKGKVALVAASSKGLGRAVAACFAAEGARVGMCARHADELRKAADEIRARTGAEVVAEVADVTKAEDITRWVAQVARSFGRIDILVNNAGGPPPGGFTDFADAQWFGAFELNLLSTVRMIREVLPHMKRAGGGRIVTIASSAVKQPVDGLVLSNTVRLGVVGLSKTLSKELAKDHITVNVVCPGYILTDRLRSYTASRAERLGRSMDEMLTEGAAEVPLARFGTPEEFANVVVFLASDRASYVTGATLQVDGGLIKGVL